MKAIRSLCIIGTLCGALALPALAEVSSKSITDSNGKPVQLAYHGKNCFWHNGHLYCKQKHYKRGYHHCRYKQCWKDYYGRVHCRCR